MDSAPATRFDLTETRAVVVGAAQGIGAGVAVALARAGSAVVLAGHDRDHLASTAASAASVGTVLATERVDVALPADVGDFAERVLRAHGAPTILVNSANVRLIADALDTGIDEWDETSAVHLRGPFLMSKAFAPAMIDRGYGKIVNFSSHWAVRSGRGRAAYGAAKAGLMQLTATLGVEWAPHGVRVNAVAPGPTLTESLRARLAADPDRAEYLRSGIPLGRMARVDEVVPTAVFLSCPDSDFITGQTVFVDGGASVTA